MTRPTDSAPMQWTRAELEDWCRGWTRTPHTTLKAFIDAGFCSDEAPSREAMRLLRYEPAPGDEAGFEIGFLKERIRSLELARDEYNAKFLPKYQAALAQIKMMKAAIPEGFAELRSHLASLPSWTPEVAQILQAAQEHIMSQISTTKPVMRPAEPEIGERWVRYRGWECAYNVEASLWGCDGWEAYLGGPDIDAPKVSARTWEGLLDEIDDHDMTEEGA